MRLDLQEFSKIEAMKSKENMEEDSWKGYIKDLNHTVPAEYMTDVPAGNKDEYSSSFTMYLMPSPLPGIVRHENFRKENTLFLVIAQ